HVTGHQTHHTYRGLCTTTRNGKTSHDLGKHDATRNKQMIFLPPALKLPHQCRKPCNSRPLRRWYHKWKYRPNHTKHTQLFI
ncbi:uncharacterized protein LACBIDRAFT_316678, partial [Laccaria bicolor S238N-H82]